MQIKNYSINEIINCFHNERIVILEFQYLSRGDIFK